MLALVLTSGFTIVAAHGSGAVPAQQSSGQQGGSTTGAGQQGTAGQPAAGQQGATQPDTPKTGSAPAGAQGGGAQAAGTQPVFRTGINYVRVDVIVSDKQGNTVGDLAPADFEILEDGKPQTIDAFKLVTLTGNPEPGAEAPRAIRSDYDEETEALRDDVRIFVILLDDYHVRRGASMAVRDPLIRFIRNQLGPLDLVGLMYPLSPVSDLRLTRNHEAIVQAIQKFDGRKYDYTPKNEFEERYSMYPASVVEQVRNEVSLSALRGLVTHLGGVREGRKAVILVSEGYSNYLPPQLRDPVASMPGVGNPARRMPTLGDNNANEERAQLMDTMDIQNELRDAFSAANRANTAIYALDPRGLAAFEYDINEGVGSRTDSAVLQTTQDTLRVLADQTDGRAIVNRNDLDGGLRQVVKDSSAYYLIGYNSTQAPADGKFHEIKVRVKRPGTQVRARRGYWAPTAAETARILAPPGPGPDPGIGKALATVEAPSRARFVRTWVGTAPAESGRTLVTFVWEPVPAIPGEQLRGQASRVALIAAGENGAAYYRGKVDAAGSPAPAPVTAAAERVGVASATAAAPAGATGAAGGSGSTGTASSGSSSAGTPAATVVAGTSVAGATGVAASPTRGGRAQFEAAPGRLQLRLSVEGAAGEMLDSDLVDVTVPDYTTPQVRLSTPEVLRARSAREFQAISADPGAVPVAGREFRRTERLLIRFSASAAGTEQPATTVKLLNRAGQPMSDLQAKPLATDGTARFQVDLPLAGLAAGEYLVEVRSTAGGTDAKQLVGFRVIS